MKPNLMAICMAVIAAIGGVALSGDVDIRALQAALEVQAARLAEQEARFSDIRARARHSKSNAYYADTPEALLSLRKNARVTVGGELNTRYLYRNAKIDSILLNPDAEPNADRWGNIIFGPYQRRANISQGDLQIADANLYVQIELNDHLDAFIGMDLQRSQDAEFDIDEKYYFRWKNICNSGFGIKVGCDALVFGEEQGMGILGSYTKNGEGAFD